MPGQLQSLRVDQILIRGRHCKDNAVRLGDVFGNQVTCLFLDIRRLVANGDLCLMLERAVDQPPSKSTCLCKTWQIDQGKTEDMGRVDFEVDRLSVDAFVASRYPGSLIFNLPLDLVEVVKLATGYVTKLAPLILSSYTGGSMWYVDLVAFRFVLVIAWNIDQLQYQGPSSDDAAATRQEVSANNVLKYRRLARRLRSYNNLVKRLVREFNVHVWEAYNLRQVKRIVSDCVKDKILQFVDYIEQVFSEGCHFVLPSIRCMPVR